MTATHDQPAVPAFPLSHVPTFPPPADTHSRRSDNQHDQPGTHEIKAISTFGQFAANAPLDVLERPDNIGCQPGTRAKKSLDTLGGFAGNRFRRRSPRKRSSIHDSAGAPRASGGRSQARSASGTEARRHWIVAALVRRASAFSRFHVFTLSRFHAVRVPSPPCSVVTLSPCHPLPPSGQA